MHTGNPHTVRGTQTQLDPNPADSFNLYTLEWDEWKLDFFINGTRVYTVNRWDYYCQHGPTQPCSGVSAPFDTEFFLRLGNQLHEWDNPPQNPPSPQNTQLPQEMTIDYVPVYQKP